MRKLLVVALAATLCVGVIPYSAAKKNRSKRLKARDVVLKTDFTPVTDEQKNFSTFPGAEGAPAVVLFKAEQARWDEDLLNQRVLVHRRTKILTDAGVESYGDYVLSLRGDWRVKKVLARTIGPDGSITEAVEGEHVFRETSDEGDIDIRIAFPAVKTGAILDLVLEIAANPWFVSPMQLQEQIPVVSARFVLIPPLGLRYQTVAIGLPPEANKARSIPFSSGTKAYYWVFDNLAPLPDVPWLPPEADIAQRLLVILDSFKSPIQYIPIAHDWKSFGKSWSDRWEDWSKESHSQAAALARQSAGEGSVRQRTQAILKALRERVRVSYNWTYPIHHAPDQVLSKGSGNSADLAGTAMTMLRAAGIKAHLAVFRRRSAGQIPGQVPVPALFNDLLLQVETPKGAIFVSPSARMSIGQLPWDCTGLLAMVLDGVSEKPVAIPDTKGSDHLTRRKTQARLNPDGSLEGTTTITYHGIAAASIRRRLADRAEDEQRARIEQGLQRWMPGATVLEFKPEHLTDWDADVSLELKWQAPTYAQRAGKRLLVLPCLFSRMQTDDWSAAERKYAVNLDFPFEEVDELELTLPEEAAGAELPGAADLNAGVVGSFTARFARKEQVLTMKRHLVLNYYTFAASQWAGLKKWFGDIATSDERPFVVMLK